MTGGPVVTLYSAPDCCLCDDARAALERVRDEHAFELVELDITRDDALQRAYFERVPVVALDGEELFELFVDEPLLRARLDATGANAPFPAQTSAQVRARPAGGADDLESAT